MSKEIDKIQEAINGFRIEDHYDLNGQITLLRIAQATLTEIKRMDSELAKTTAELNLLVADLSPGKLAPTAIPSAPFVGTKTTLKPSK